MLVHLCVCVCVLASDSWGFRHFLLSSLFSTVGETRKRRATGGGGTARLTTEVFNCLDFFNLLHSSGVLYGASGSLQPLVGGLRLAQPAHLLKVITWIGSLSLEVGI